MIFRTTDAEKKSWKRLMGDHDVVVSNVGPGILASMNLGGSGLLSSSSLSCHLSSSLSVDASLLFPRLVTGAEVTREEHPFFRLAVGGGAAGPDRGVNGWGCKSPGAVLQRGICGGGALEGPGTLAEGGS